MGIDTPMVNNDVPVAEVKAEGEKSVRQICDEIEKLAGQMRDQIRTTRPFYLGDGFQKEKADTTDAVLNGIIHHLKLIKEYY